MEGLVSDIYTMQCHIQDHTQEETNAASSGAIQLLF
jgi:hypothetical protein